MTLRADIVAIDEDVRRVGTERAQIAWSRLRRLLVALDEVCRKHERSEDDTVERPL